MSFAGAPISYTKVSRLSGASFLSLMGMILINLSSGIALIICILSQGCLINVTCVRKYSSFQTTNLQGHSISSISSGDRMNGLTSSLLCSNLQGIASGIETNL